MNSDSMSEADLTKSFTHDRPEPTTQPPTERPAKACSVCGQPLPLAVLDFHPTKQDCIKALRARVEKLEKAVKFYADPVTWMIWINHPEHPAKVEADRGKLAREALA